MSKQSKAEKLESIKEDICDNYCKFPWECSLEHEDPEEGYEAMLKERCADCPLNRL